MGDASPKPVESSRKIPFQQHDHLIVVKGSIGSLNDLNLVIDTGASQTVIGRHIARKLHLRGKPVEVASLGSRVRMEEVMIPELRMGSERFQSVKASVGELPRLRGIHFDALVGLDALKRTNLRIDFQTRTILFGPIIHTGAPIRFYRNISVLMVPVRVGGCTLRLMLDSGADEIILFGKRVSGRVSMRRPRDKKRIQHTGGRLELPKVLISESAMGHSQWRELSAFIMNGSQRGLGILDGVLGLSPLNLKSLTIDFERALMSWES